MSSAGTPPAEGQEPAEPELLPRLSLERARQAAREKGYFPTAAGRAARRDADRRGDGALSAERAGQDPGEASRRWRPGPGLGHGISGPGPSRRDPAPLGRIAERVVTERGWSAPVSVGGVVGRWREVVGDQIADHCEVETFEEGKLVLRAASTAWANQLRILQPQLERRLAEEVGEGVVTQITVLGPGGPSWKRGRRSVRGRGPRDTYG